MGSVLVDGSPLNLKKVPRTANGVFTFKSSFSSSLPSSLMKEPLPPPVHQPPLLPLPSPRFPSASSPRKKAKGHHQQQIIHRKLQPQQPAAVEPPSDPPKAKNSILVPLNVPRGRVDEEIIDLESVYSKSPPPSSLPLPRFALTKPRTGAPAVVSCLAGTTGVGDCGGGGVDAGATNNLRRLLGL